VKTFDTQTINSAKSPKEGPISHNDGNSILGKSGGGSILGNLLAQKRPYTSEEESIQARNMRKWQSLKPPKEGAKNLRLRVSSQSRSRGSSQNSPQKRSDKGSQRSKTSEVQKNQDNMEQAPKEKTTDSEKNRPQTVSNTRSNNESKKNQLAEKLQKLKRPSMMNNFQSSSNRLNSTNLSNKKSIRDVSFRNGSTS
jgi:hypothetical protein